MSDGVTAETRAASRRPDARLWRTNAGSSSDAVRELRRNVLVTPRTWLPVSYRHRLPAVARRFSKFGLVGASGVGVNLAIFALLTSGLGWHYLLASAVAAELALCSNYVLNNNWTFVDRRDGRFSVAGLLRYHAVSCGGMAINLAVLHFLVDVVGTHVLLANLCGIGMGTVWNFALNACWTWRRTQVRL